MCFLTKSIELLIENERFWSKKNFTTRSYDENNHAHSETAEALRCLVLGGACNKCEQNLKVTRLTHTIWSR